ncbi:hypothetical protein SUGI_1034270 [Cryptomeria japonica]|uniref:uncharacterized protein LOC131051680 n=1 Tax=Cryptomeria japonica TaxID=3369 RepID=UPI002414CCC5|nr:uncharacterized protein LOC131051680 [Cryptomeria japonica]GLJ49028.1 hypothetical protein SUGI_1034270 [Cryptomeria japonica]
MMIRSCSSSILGHGGSVSEPHMGTESSNYGNHKHPICSCAGFKKRRSHKGEEPFAGEISAVFRRGHSESNLVPLFVRNEEANNQRIEKWRLLRVMCSRKNGLLITAADGTDELNTKDVLDEEKLGSSLKFENPLENLVCSGEDQSERMSSLSEGEYKIPVTHKMNRVHRIEDDKPSVCERMSENQVDGYSSLEIGAKGMALVCTERGCRPALLCDKGSITQGIDNEEAGVGVARTGGEGRSSSTDSISTDVYYQKMLEANPQNPLLLRNYAKFLHEVQRDIERAEKWYGRAILASPGDGEILVLYAKFIWEIHNDAARAEAYYDRAVKAASQDCYVLGSYANFLWDSENNEDENDFL